MRVEGWEGEDDVGGGGWGGLKGDGGELSMSLVVCYCVACAALLV